ncbi:MAG: hypothetical protein JO223_10815 [Hyphomicrobiales bacterium]|nr:hypothetical protein [Hyphomicrobiales bacterium]
MEGESVPDGSLTAVTAPPKSLPGIPTARRVRAKTAVKGTGLLRRRWQTKDGAIYEWDYQHGAVEKYNKRGVHEGEFDGNTGEQTGPAIPTRRIKP